MREKQRSRQCNIVIISVFDGEIKARSHHRSYIISDRSYVSLISFNLIL